MPNIKLYRHALSGHSHRVEVFLSMLGLNATHINIDLANGEQNQADFIAKNIFAQVPVLEDAATIIADANAILIYLATKYDNERIWLPTDAVNAAEVQRFLSIAAGQLVSGPAAARRVTVFGAKLDAKAAIENTHSILRVLEAHMLSRDWLATDEPSIADVANYTYIAHAPEGNVSLQEYPNIRIWLKRFESLAGFIPMQATSVGLAV